MTREKAMTLLRNGLAGITDWNYRREAKEKLPDLTGVNLSEAKLTGADLTGANLSEAKLGGAKLKKAKLIRANLTGAKLKKAKLIRANLTGADFTRANLSEAKLGGAKLIRVKLIRANLTGADLSWANLTGAKLIRADLSWANLTGAKLGGADLSWANLSWANLTGANLSEANLSEANLSEAKLGGSNLTRSNLTRSNLIRSNLAGSNLTGSNLTGSDLTGSDLTGANLTGSDLTGSDLTGANLTGANLGGSDLTGANLTGANLTRASLKKASLTGASLKKANLTRASLKKADLGGANLTGADLGGADLTGANLTQASLTLARMFRTNLTGTLVEDAIVQDAQISQLRGLPIPARTLRLGSRTPYTQLTGDEAASFFVLPAVVEVFLTLALADMELGCLHFHQGEVHANRVATDVYLVGHRHEAGGSVLRFQGPSYDAVYAALPDLLAAFRTTEAIDWKKTLKEVPKDERGEVITALVKTETRLKTGRWQLAARLADAFEGFADARVVKLVEGRKKGVAITVFSDETMLENLTRAYLASIPTIAELLFRKSGTHDAPAIEKGGGDTFIINGPVTGTALGRSAHVTSEQIIANNQGNEILPDTHEPPGTNS